jgi:hypothetical protein
VTPVVMSLLLAAAAPSGPAFLDCRLVTPNGRTVAVTASVREPGGSNVTLTPVVGSVWPAARLAGHGTLSEGQAGLQGTLHFDGSPEGAVVKIEGERATLVVTHGDRTSLPRAYGFCLPASPAERDDQVPVTTNAAIDAVPAFNSASWPDEGCVLITRSGRRARVNYQIAEGGAKAVMAANDGLLPAPSVRMKRGSARDASGPRISIGGDQGPSGYEIFLVDEKAAEAVKLLEFKQLGGPATGNEPAAAICGYAKITRRAVMR